MPRGKGSKKGVIKYPVFYHIRVGKSTLEKLKKVGSKKVRRVLERL